VSARCDFTDLPADSCAHCLGHADPGQQAKAERARLLASGRGWFPALYPGTCEHCGARFEPGAAIRMEIPAGWRGECCADVTR
jgi:hypothetical protein